MSTKRLRAIRIVLASMLLLSSMALLSPVAQADTSVTVNATQRYQTIQGLGVNANVHSWNNGQLVPALDQLTDQLGATAFRVVIDNADWEATNDNTDPNVFNWDYYNTVYGSTKFTDLWNTIAYLNSKHATVSISVMGPLPTWMGGSSLLPNQEPEWVEMMASLIYYGRVVKGLNVTLFEPFNEPDLTNGIEGVQAGAAQVVRVMHELGDRLDTLGLSDVKFILPDTASTGSGLGAYFTAMQGDSDLMGKVAALGLHNYGGDTGGADSLIKGSSYPALPFWMTEFSAPCSGCDYGSPNPADWPFAKTMAQYMMNNLSQNAAGAEVWEGYDSFYEHHSSWSYWGLLGFDHTAGTYSPRKSFYAMTQFMRFIPRGSVRIGASSGNGNLSLLAFHDPSSGRVTLVGLNTSSAAETISGTLTGIDGLNSMAYYRTNATANMESVGDVPVTAGQFSTTVPADTLFTLTGVAGPDTTPPTVALTSPTAGATVAGPMQLTATASDDRGVTRVEFSVNNTVVGSATQAPYQVAWDARTVDPGTHTITARAVDAAGNSASSSAEVTVIRDITPPSTPAGLEASSPTAGEVRLSWQPSTDNIAVAGYVVLRDGTSVGSATTTTYVDTTVISGHTYSYTVEARDTSDNVSPPSTPVTVTVGSQVVVTVDTTATTHQTSAASTITSPPFSTTKAGDLLVVFAGSDGSTTSAQSFNSVTGAGLTWRLRQRANAQAGTAEIWTAVAPATLSNVQVTATRGGGAYVGSLTVVAFSGADTVTDGATAGKSAASGAPSVQLTTTRANSWVWAVGHDWDRAIARTVPADQELVDQYLATVQDTFWVQRLKAPTPNAGTLVTVNDAAPTTDRWNFSAIEIRPASAPPPDTTPPAVAITAPTASATVSGTTNVTASASDNIGVTKVEFYVDGGMPVATTTTAPYTFSWNTTTFANGSHHLTAKAYDEAGNSATSSTVTVTVDNGDHTPPTITITTPANGATVSGTTNVTASATDNVDVTKVEFYVDDGSTPVATTTTAPYTFGWNTTTVSDGQHQLIAQAYDEAGNVGTSATVSVQVDNADHIPPTPPTGLSATALSATEVGLSWQASSDNVGVTGYTVFRDGTQVGTSASTSYHDTTVQPSTTYTYTVAARDAAGNVSGPSNTATVTTLALPDTTPPAVDITSPANGATVSGIVTVTANASDNVGVTRVEFYVDSTLVATDATAPYSYSWDTTKVSNGTHELSAKASDAAGNIGTSEVVAATVNNVDATVPTVAITAPPAGATVSGTTTVTASASDNVGVTKVEFYVDGLLKATTTTTPYAFSWDTTTVTNGAHNLTAKAYDTADNVGTSTAVSVTVDNADRTPPTVAITSPTNDDTVSGTTTVTASASDNVGVTKVEFYVDGTLATTDMSAPYSYSWDTTKVTNGTHELSAKAYDDAGNVGTSTAVSVTVNNADTSPPSAPTNLTATAISPTEVQLGWTASSDTVGVTGYAITRDGIQIGTATGTSFRDTTVQPSSSYTYTVTARDAAGNVSAPSDPATITTPAPPDMTAPTVAITEPAAGASVSDTTTVTATATDNIGVTKVELYVDGTLVGSDASAPYSFAWNTTTTPNGTHELSTKAYDAAGNVGTSSPVPVTVANATTLSVDASVTTDQTRASTTTTSPAFSTTKAGDLLVVFVGSDGPDRSSSQSFRSVTGGGLTWRLRQRANAQAGTAEIWTAVAPATLSNVRVTATRARGSYLGSLTVVAFSGADTTTDGTTAGASAASGAPTVRLTTTRANAWVWAVGNDWDRAIARTVPTGQTLVHQYLPSIGDTFWVQRLDEPTPAAGTTVTIHDTAPTTDRWNFSAIEIVPRSATPPSSKGG